MKLRAKIKKILRENYGEFNTNLEHQYESKLTESLIIGNNRDRQAWVTYNQVIIELKNTLKNTLKVNELQYRLTDDGDPNTVCIEVMEEIKRANPELERLYNKIKNF